METNMNKFNRWLKSTFGKPDKHGNFLPDSFNDKQKKQIVNSALTTAGQILMTAVVLTNSEKFITGDCVYPDGSKWVIKFEKVG
jgi:hypothetical protein